MWIITVPKTVKWQDYEKELQDALSMEMFYRVRGFPKEMKIGQRCYVVHDGFVKGYMLISSMQDRKGFVCQTTGNTWPDGKYIGRIGKFTYLEDLVPMTGFRGIRKYPLKQPQ